MQEGIQQLKPTRTTFSSIQLGRQYRYLSSFTSSEEFNVNSTGTLTCCSEYLFRGTEPVCFRHPDGKPDEAKKEIDEIQADRELEHEGIQSGGKVIDGDGQYQNTLGDGPDEGTPLDIVIVCPSGEINFPDRQLRHNIIGGGLCIIPGVQ